MRIGAISAAAVTVGLSLGFATGWLTRTSAAAQAVPTVPPVSSLTPVKPPDDTFAKKIQPFLNTYCNSCHNSDKAAGGVALDVYLSEAHARKDRKS